MSPAPVRRGRPLTDAERAMLKAAEDLGPAASLARIETTARLTFTAVVGATGLITTLGLTTDARRSLLEDQALLGMSWPLALLLASLLMAGGALVPALRVVDPTSPTEVAAFYRSAIVRRGTLVLSSLLLLAIGLIAAVAVVVDAAPRPPRLTATAQRSGGKLRVEATASIDRAGDRPLLLIMRDSATGTVLCRSIVTGTHTSAVAHCGPLIVSSHRIQVGASAGLHARSQLSLTAGN